MNDAMKQRVEQFVQEILSLADEACGESRSEALRVVSTMLASDPAPASRRNGQARRRVAMGNPAGVPQTPPVVIGKRVDKHGDSPTPAAPVGEAPTSAVPERELRVLSALGDLVRATASEVAGHTGQPNGSVSVVLRSLVARGQVAREQTARGTEYSLVRRAEPRRRANGSATAA